MTCTGSGFENACVMQKRPQAPGHFFCLQISLAVHLSRTVSLVCGNGSFPFASHRFQIPRRHALCRTPVSPSAAFIALVFKLLVCGKRLISLCIALLSNSSPSRHWCRHQCHSLQHSWRWCSNFSLWKRLISLCIALLSNSSRSRHWCRHPCHLQKCKRIKVRTPLHTPAHKNSLQSPARPFFHFIP